MVLVTGCAGFIGTHVARRLLTEGHEVVGADLAVEDRSLGRARLGQLEDEPGFCLRTVDVGDPTAVEHLFCTERPTRVVHLAGEVAVRGSVQDPGPCLSTNLVGFTTVLEACRRHAVEHLVYASSSAVYGSLPQTSRAAEHPLSPYAATKRADELLAHAWSASYGLPTTGLRLFAVYGPWSRPDTALSLFTSAILDDRPIRLYGHGQMRRDFTWVDDVAEAVVRVLGRPAEPDPTHDPSRPDPTTSTAPFRIFDVGTGRAVRMAEVLSVVERCLGKAARVELHPVQPGEVHSNCADAGPLLAWVGYRPSTPVEVGILRFVEWYRGWVDPSS